MRVFLTGVGCVGKTTIGLRLPELMGRNFFDLDTEIELFFGMSRPMDKRLTNEERPLYLKEIKKDIAYFKKSYTRADLQVSIEDMDVEQAAHHILARLKAYRPYCFLIHRESVAGGVVRFTRRSTLVAIGRWWQLAVARPFRIPGSEFRNSCATSSIFVVLKVWWEFGACPEFLPVGALNFVRIPGACPCRRKCQGITPGQALQVITGGRNDD